jgi:hypothetical protein
LVTGGNSARASGALADAIRALDAQGIGYAVFDGIGPNPLISACHRAGETARDCGAEFLIGIGGGSPLDATKAVAIYAANADLTAEAIYKREYEHPPLPVVLIGTTAGTGSEVTSVAVLTDDASGRKKSILGPDCYASLVFADPEYTHSVPYEYHRLPPRLTRLRPLPRSPGLRTVASGITELFALQRANRVMGRRSECSKVAVTLPTKRGARSNCICFPTTVPRAVRGVVINVCSTAVFRIRIGVFGLPRTSRCAPHR